MKFEEVLEKAKNEEITREEALFLFKEAGRYNKLLELFKVACEVREEEVGTVYKSMRVRLSNPSLHQPLPLNIRIASLTEINIV